jgi:hypothetical protein
MERSGILAARAGLKLNGMRAASCEIVAAAVRRPSEPQTVVAELLRAGFAQKVAHSIRCRFAAARLPVARELEDVDFDWTPIGETPVRDLAAGGVIAQQRNAVLIGGTGTGMAHIVSAIALACVRRGGGGFRRAVLPPGGPCRPAGQALRSSRPLRLRGLRRAGPSALRRTGDQLPMHLVSRPHGRVRVDVTHTLAFGGWPVRHCPRTNGDQWLARSVAKMTTGLLDRLTRHLDIVETRNGSRRAGNRA